jgi:hypothetical protein
VGEVEEEEDEDREVTETRRTKRGGYVADQVACGGWLDVVREVEGGQPTSPLPPVYLRVVHGAEEEAQDAELLGKGSHGVVVPVYPTSLREGDPFELRLRVRADQTSWTTLAAVCAVLQTDE